MLTILLIALAVLLACFTIGFFLAFRRQRIDIVDVYWGLSFAVMATTLFLLTPQPTPTFYIATFVVLLWAFRLSSHVARRIARSKEQDARYTKLTSKWPRKAFWMQVYVRIFLVQTLLAFIVAAPVLIIAASTTFSWVWLIVGSLVWLIGFLFESIADQQLASFLAEPKNQGKLMTTGLWRYSRHPNYFGELTMWWGIWLLSVGMSGWWVALIGPLTISFLLRYVSGVPLAERSSSSKPGWDEYARRTPALIPKLR